MRRKTIVQGSKDRKHRRATSTGKALARIERRGSRLPNPLQALDLQQVDRGFRSEARIFGKEHSGP